MPRPIPALLVPVTLVVALALTACDPGADPSPDPEPSPQPPSVTGTAAPDAVRAGIAALYAGDDGGSEQLAEADCFADALLARLDDGELRAAGIVQDDGTVPAVLPVLDVATAQEWVAAQGECADFVTVSTRAVVTQSKGKVDPAVYETCLREALTAEEVDAAIVDTLTGRFDTEGVRALGEAQADCSRSAQPPD